MSVRSIDGTEYLVTLYRWKNRIFSLHWALPWPPGPGFDSLLRSQESARGGPLKLGAGGGGRPRPDTSFKWGLKTGHFYRFIRTFRTSWAAGGGRASAGSSFISSECYRYAMAAISRAWLDRRKEHFVSLSHFGACKHQQHGPAQVRFLS